MDHARQNLEAAQVLRVLMLEDRDDDALLVEHALRKTGFAYTLQRARGKTDFTERLDPGLDLIMADFHVPGFGGLQALEAVKRKGLDVPLIVVSGAITEAEAAEAVRRGAADYVLKDYLGRLGTAITAALEQKALRSEMREAHAALAKTENEFRSAFEHAATGMAFTTLDGRWLRVNPALCEIVGYAEDEMLRTHCHSVTHAEDIAEDERLLRQLVAGEIESSRRDKRYVHKRGHTVWVNVTASLVRDPDGTPLYRVLQVIDISRRIRADERFRSTFEQAAVGIAHTTADGRFLVVNDKLCEMLGYSREELVSSSALELSHPATRGQYAELYQEVAEGRRPRFSGEKRWVRKDGSVIWVNRTVSRADSAIELEPYLIQVIEDITERKRTEESLERANRARLVLAECNHAQTRATDESELLEDMCRAAVELGRYRQAWVGLATGDSLRPVYAAAHAGYGGDAPMTAPATWTADGRYHGLAGEAIAHGETRIARDILNDPRHAAKRERALQLEYQSSIALPIRGEGRILAVLVLHATERDAFDNDEILLLTELADDIGFGITTLRTRDARRKAEAALRESEERFRVLTELSSDWSWEQDADFRFTEVSMTVKSQAGISAEDHVGRTRWELPRTDPVNTTWDEHEAMLRAHRPFHDLILRRTGEDGSVDYVSVSGRPMFDAKGAFKGYRGVAKNITDKIRADTALRESERRFREMFEQAAVGITRVDLGGFLVDFNQKFCEMLGYEREELLGRHLREITHPDDYGQGSQYRAQVTDGTAKSRAGEKRFVRKDGAILWARRTMSAACDDAGNPRYIISVVEDITERKKVEELYRTTLDNAPVGIMHVDMDRRILHVNPKLCEILGYTREELLGMTQSNVIHPDYRGKDLKKYLDRMLRGEITSYSSERPYLRKDGSVVWVNRTASLVRDAAGKPLHFIRIIEDISERKQLEHQFQDTFEQAAVGIAHVDFDDRYLRVNSKFCEIVGYPEQALLNEPALILSHPDDIGSGEAARKRLLAGEIASHSNEKRYVRKDGSVIWVNRTESVARDEAGRPLYFIRVIEDITARKEVEECYWATFEHAPVGIMHTDMDNDRILHANPKLCEMLGYTQQELISLTTDQILHPDHVGGDRPKYREKLLKGELDSFSSERLYMHKDGSPVWVNRTVSLVRDAAGKPQYFIRIVEDISERKRAEEAVARERSLLRTIIDTLPDYIYVKDRAGRFRLANEAWLKARRITMEDIAGKTVFDMFPREVAERMAAQDAAIVKTGAPLLDFEQLIIVKTPDGEQSKTQWASTTKAPMRDSSGDIIGTVGVSRDISERRVSDQRRSMEHAVTRVLAESETLEEAMPVIIRTICENHDWACGSHWQWDGNAEMLRCAHSWHIQAEEVAEFIAFTRTTVNEAPAWHGEAPRTQSGGLVRRVWASGAPVWFPDVTQQPDFRRGPVAAKAGLHCAFGFPILAGVQALGVMEFYSREIKEPDDALLQVVRSIGRQTGQFIQRKRAEETAAREGALLRAVVDRMPDRIYVKGRDGRLILMNEAALKLRGRTHEEIVGKTVYDMFPRGLAEQLEAEDRGVMDTGIALVDRERSVTVAGHDGSPGAVLWNLTTKVPMQDAAGNVIGLLGVNRDITDRKRAEVSLRENEERLRAMFEQASVGIHVTSPDGRFLQVNDKYCNILGYGREELLKIGVFDINFEQQRNEAVDLRKKAVAGEINAFTVEKQLRRKDGLPVWANITTSAVRGPEGALWHFISVVQDISERKRAEEALRENEVQLRAMFEQAAVGITMSTLDLDYVQVNDKFCDIVGYSREELLRMSVRDVNLPENMDDAVGYRRKLFSGEIQGTVREKPLRRKDGSAVWVSLVTSVIRDNTGNPKHFISVIQDISQRKRAEAALMESEEQFRQLAGNIPQVFWIGDVAQKRTVYVSPASERMLGLPPEELSGNPRKLVRAVHPDDRARVYRARRSAISGQYDETYRVIRPDGSIRWVHDRAFPVRDASGVIYRIAGIAEDITARKEAEEQLLQLAHYDVLTSLPNRVLFYDRLKQALAQAKRNQWITGVMFIDLDRFKNVNDTLGHTTGDKLLQQVSGRLTRAVRTGDTVGRLGGDEFAVVLSNLSSTQDASLVAQKIMAAFNEPFQLDGSEIYITVSIGITLYPNDSTDQDTLIKNADAAMYRAKDVGRNSYQFYTPEMNARSLEMLSLESSLRRALDRNEFLFYYQPKASIASGEITGLEALLRWRHPVRGLVSPADFIPLMEETGLIVQAGSWILNTVCSQIAEWQRAGIKPVPIAVNLSARQFLARDLGPGIKRVLEEYQIDPALIELEITESSLMVNTEEAARTLEYLKSLGVGLAIDDFGTGYSSFGYLKRFPLDALKLDRSFVRDITTDADDATITRAVISMAHSLGLTIVAEGVETEAQLAFLAEYGCDQVQGYYFARPMGAEECSAWLREQRRLQRPRTGDDSNAPLVLLVDDDEDALTLIKRALAKDGNRVLTARNAHEALEMLGQHQVDVVISDQSMPGIPGVEFLQRVKALSPRTVRMMTSGYSDFRFLTEAVNKSEIFRFLPKSLTEEELRADVREALRARAEAHDAHYAIPGTTGK